LLSHYRPSVPIIAFSPNQEVRRRMALLWGVVPRVLEPIQETEAMVRRVEEELLSRGFANKGERAVIVFGAPIGQPGKINSLTLPQITGRRGGNDADRSESGSLRPLGELCPPRRGSACRGGRWRRLHPSGGGGRKVRAQH